MRALSLTQPYATLMALGHKKIETRSWACKARGYLALHAAKTLPPEYRRLFDTYPFQRVLVNAGYVSLDDLPRGAIVAVGHLESCRPTTDLRHLRGLAEHELAFGDYSAHRFMWIFSTVQALTTPVPCIGALSTWQMTAEIEAAVLSQVAVAQNRQLVL